LERITICVNNLLYRLNQAGDGAADAALQERVGHIMHTFQSKMDDDFNTPDAITTMFELVNEANSLLQKEQTAKASLAMLYESFQKMDSVLGIMKVKADELLDDDVERLIAERIDARAQKKWARADEIRDLLTEQGIILEDTPQGLRWRRK